MSGASCIEVSALRELRRKTKNSCALSCLQTRTRAAHEGLIVIISRWRHHT